MSCVIFAVVLAFSFAFAQERFETGSLSVDLDGEERVLFSYYTDVPVNVADGVEDEGQRAILERVAGTEQHTATFTFADAVTLGTTVLVPAKVHVSLQFANGELDLGVPGSIGLQFSLDPEGLQLGAPEDVEIRYAPNRSSFTDFYALTEGGLTLDSVEVVDENTLRVSGSFSGLFTHQTGYDVVHNPADVIPAQGTFTVERVVGSGLALEFIGIGN